MSKLRKTPKATLLLVMIGIIFALGNIGKVDAFEQDLKDGFYVIKRYSSFPVCKKSQVTVKNLLITQDGRRDGQVDACIYKTKKYDYAESSSLRLVRAIGQEKFYMIYGSESLVISGMNTEIATLRHNGSSEASFSASYVGVTDSLSDAIEPVLYAGQSGEIEIQNYTLNNSKFTWVTASNGDKVEVEGVAVSDNGRYLAYVDRSYRLTLVDRDNGSRKTVAENVRYWKGNYREPSFGAVSSNGRFVYVSGYERMYDTHDCSQDKTECEYIENAEYKRRGLRSIRSYFDDVEERLMLLNGEDAQLNRYDEIGLYGYLKLPDYHGIEYLALGDSYTSGEGDIGDLHIDPYLGDTGQSESCHLSYRSYPYLLGRMWELDSSQVKSIACSGARVLPDYYGAGLYYGQKRQLTSFDSDHITQERAKALQDFTPGIVRQIDFVESYKPKKVTFTGGGNDVGFANIIEYCAKPQIILNIPVDDTCLYAYGNSQMRADLNRTIDDQYIYNRRFIEKIKDVSPVTEIYMIGYPQFVSESSLFCSYDSVILNRSERIMITESVSRLNNILKKVAQDTGVYFVDIEDSLNGGRICETSLYMTGPGKVVLKKLVTRDSNMYHPNSRGHEKIAEAINKRIKDGMYYEVIDIPSEADGRKVIQTAVLPDYAGVGSKHTVNMSPGMFGPNGEVIGEWFSKIVHAGSVTTNNDGSFTMEITVPEDIGLGSHLLSFSGMGPDGTPTVVQQFVNITSNNDNDIDADGIPNEIDKCFVVVEWFENGKNVCDTSTDMEYEKVEKQAERVNPMKALTIFTKKESQVALSDIVGYASDLNLPYKTTSQTEEPTAVKYDNAILLLIALAIMIGVSGYYVIKSSSKKRNK